MINLIIILFCLGVGLLLQHLKHLPDNMPQSLNQYVIYVALPALILYEIPHLRLNADALLPIAFAWLLMSVTAIMVFIIARMFRWDSSITGALMLTVPLGNTGFLGIPLIEALLGKEAIPYAILYDQFGSFLALNLYGGACAAYYAGKAESKRQLFKTIFTFPPFLALVTAFISLFSKQPEWISQALAQISSTLVPVVMVAVGMQWQLKTDAVYRKPLVAGVILCLCVTPCIAWLLLWCVGWHQLSAQVVILEAAMPAMISAGVLANNYNLAPRLASSLVGYSLLFSLLTVWAWRQLL